jgi:hypothetical protein
VAIALVSVALSGLIRPPEKFFSFALCWSTSKASVALWTFGLIFAFLAILIHTRGDGLDNLKLSSQYLALLGIPAGAAMGAKAITQNKINKGQLTKHNASSPPDALQGTAQLFSDDPRKRRSPGRAVLRFQPSPTGLLLRTVSELRVCDAA